MRLYNPISGVGISDWSSVEGAGGHLNREAFMSRPPLIGLENLSIRNDGEKRTIVFREMCQNLIGEPNTLFV